MVTSDDRTGRISRRRALALVGTGAAGSVGGCLSFFSTPNRDLSFAFLRIANLSRDHERTFEITLAHDDDTVIDDSYTGVPPARAPMAVLTTPGTGLYYGVLPGGTGVDTTQFDRQLPPVHTIRLERREQLAGYELQVSTSEFTEYIDLVGTLGDREEAARPVEDEATVGVQVEALSSRLTTKFFAFESFEDHSLLEDFLDAERVRQEHRDEFGEETVDDSPYT